MMLWVEWLRNCHTVDLEETGTPLFHLSWRQHDQQIRRRPKGIHIERWQPLLETKIESLCFLKCNQQRLNF
jgi:hypothetical protein